MNEAQNTNYLFNNNKQLLEMEKSVKFTRIDNTFEHFCLHITELVHTYLFVCYQLINKHAVIDYF